MVEIYSVAVEERKERAAEKAVKSSGSKMKRQGQGKSSGKGAGGQSPAERVVEEWEESQSAHTDTDSGLSLSQQQLIIAKAKQDATEAERGDYYSLMQLTEEMLSGRDAGRTNSVVSALVQYVIRSWRDHFARTVSMKFNCFYLMPLLDDFPEYLRREVDAMHENGDIGELFDIYETRQALQHRKEDLLSEIAANHKLQERFEDINSQLHGPPGAGAMMSPGKGGSAARMAAVGQTDSDTEAEDIASGFDNSSYDEDDDDDEYGEPEGGSGAWGGHFEEGQ
jgi:hypothetical protein